MTFPRNIRTSVQVMLVLFGLFASCLVMANLALSQSTRAQLAAQNNLVIGANGVGAITGPVLNTVLNAGIQSYGTLLDAQTWAATQTFTVNPVFPGMVLNGTTITGVNSSGNIALLNGSIVSGNCLQWSATGIQDAGAVCGTGGGGGVTSIATTSPITGGTITTTGTIACATCVTSSGGGAITGTAPVAVSAAGVVSITGAAGQVLAGASPAFTATPTLGVAGSTVGSLAFANATSGSITLQPVTGALVSSVITLPAITDTMAGIAATQTLTNKTISGASNTLTNIGNGSLTNSATTVNGQTCTLGSTCTVTVPISTGVTGLGTGIATALAVNTGSAGAPVLFNGAGGTPTSLTLTNATGLPTSSLTGLGTGVATALGVNVGSAGAFITFNGAAGTPSSITLTNGTACSISACVSGLGTNVATALGNTLNAVSGVVAKDANGNITAVSNISGFTTTATAAGTTTLTITSNQIQAFTGATTQTVKLPTTSVVAGQTYTIINQSSGAVTVQSSGANTITILAGGTSAIFTANVATPTTAANWNSQYLADIIASGKILNVSNSLTFTGTDGNSFAFPSGSDTVVTLGASQTLTSKTLTSPTLTTPVINGTSTGTGVATAATASTLALRDANGSITAVNSIEGFTSTATAAGTTALTVSSNKTQVFTGSTTQTVTLPTTSVVAGQCWIIVNNSTGLVTVQSSGANTITILGSLTSGSFCALVATPTTAANWNDQYLGLVTASGKVLTASNSLTLAGTDATTMTFPGTSSTVVTTGNTATITKGYTVTANNIGTVSSGTTTLDCTAGNYQFLSNNGAFTLAAPASDCAIDLLDTNAASAGAITFSGFTVGASTGDSLTTTNTNKFLISVVRINGTATYVIKALQ